MESALHGDPDLDDAAPIRGTPPDRLREDIDTDADLPMPRGGAEWDPGEAVTLPEGCADAWNHGGLWNAAYTAGAPEGRSEHVAVWTGDRMEVWNGILDDPAPCCGSPTLTDTGEEHDPQPGGIIFDFAPTASCWIEREASYRSDNATPPPP